MPAASPSYVYRATVLHVVDGDTVALDVDLGFHIRMDALCRLAGLNARELSEPGGREARDHLEELVHPGDIVTVTSVHADKYAGRFDAQVVLAGSVYLNRQLIDEQWAVVWDGTGSRPVPPWPRTVAP